MIFKTEKDYSQEQIQRLQNTYFDAIIIGGGSSGLISALTMLEKGFKVAIVEAGPLSFYSHLSNSELRFQYGMLRQQRRQHQYGQQMPNGAIFGPNISCVGGRGMFWNGAAPRFNTHDFEGWPITAKELEPHYDWMEKQFRVSTVLGQTQLAENIISNISDSTSSKAQPAPFAYNDSKAHNGMLPSGVSSGFAMFLRNTTEKERIENYDLLASTYANKIIHTEGKATGVIVSNDFLKEIELKGKNILVACGGIESAKILHHSKIPDPHKRIGKGIQEHLFYRTFWHGPHLYNEALKDNAAVFVPSTSQQSEQVEIHAPGRFLISTDNEHDWNPEISPRYQIMIRSFAATRKSDDNYLEFDENRLGGAIVHFNLTEFEEKLKTNMKNTVTSIGKSLKLVLDADMYAGVGGSYHEAGGLDMGTDEKKSVVDPNGLVHTMKNVYVVDASAFPRIGATNPHLTIGAMARKQTLNLIKKII